MIDSIKSILSPSTPGLYAKLNEKLEEMIQFLEKEIIESGGDPKYIREIMDSFKYVKIQLRKCRIFDISVPDVTIVLINCYCISLYLNYPFWIVLIFMCFLGIIIHRVLGIRTKSDRWLFPDTPIPVTPIHVTDSK